MESGVRPPLHGYKSSFLSAAEYVRDSPGISITMISTDCSALDTARYN